jgi:hypothetical protein
MNLPIDDPWASPTPVRSVPTAAKPDLPEPVDTPTSISNTTTQLAPTQLGLDADGYETAEESPNEPVGGEADADADDDFGDFGDFGGSEGFVSGDVDHAGFEDVPSPSTSQQPFQTVRASCSTRTI